MLLWQQCCQHSPHTHKPHMATQFGNYIRKDRQLNKPLKNPNFLYLTTLGTGRKPLLAPSFCAFVGTSGILWGDEQQYAGIELRFLPSFSWFFARRGNSVCTGGGWSGQGFVVASMCPSDSVTIAGTRKAVHKKVELWKIGGSWSIVGSQ